MRITVGMLSLIALAACLWLYASGRWNETFSSTALGVLATIGIYSLLVWIFGPIQDEKFGKQEDFDGFTPEALLSAALASEGFASEEPFGDPARGDDKNASDAAFRRLQNAIHYLDHAPAGFMASEPDGKIVYINATLADWLGIDLGTFQPGSLRLPNLAADARAADARAGDARAADSESLAIDSRLTRADGSTFPVRLYCCAPREDDGAPGRTRTMVVPRHEEGGAGGVESEAVRVDPQASGASGGNRDFDERFEQGQKMQALGQLAGAMAHDFNNVLTAIVGFSDLLLSNHRRSDPSFQDIMNIRQNAERAASMVQQLLAFSRRQTLNPQPLDVSERLADLRILLDRLLGERIELKISHERDPWPILADRTQFDQMIMNLALNAHDAMPEGGRLEIRTSNIPAEEIAAGKHEEASSSDHVLVEVEDQGIGISPEVRDKIFEPFFSTKEVGKGTGLGLSTVYGIVKQTGGFIRLESEPGKTVFRVFLPRHVPAPGEEGVKAATESDREKPVDLTGSETLLLVEDEDAVRAFASRALSSRGYRVREAVSGAQAIQIVDQEKGGFDLVISDVVMPEMDGPTFMRELRERYPSLKFLFMSGYAQEAFERSLPQGQERDFGFLAKPFTLKELAQATRSALDE